MNLKSIFTACLVLTTVSVPAQDIFVSTHNGAVANFRANSTAMTYSETGQKLTIQGTTFNTADINSITLNAPSGMKYVGGDISRLPEFETAGAVYKDASGNTITPLTFFKEQGWNAIRVRLFVNPSTTATDGAVQSLDFVTKLGKRIKDAGYQFMLDFHYSDTWADPGKQYIPTSWTKDKSASALQDTLYNYTKRCLQHLVANGAQPDLIQTGNEISYGMLWDVGKVQAYSTSNWDVFTGMLKRAIAACREVCPKAKVIIHTERSGDATTSVKYYSLIKQYGVDYDIIGLSYYPFYHGFLPALETTLTNLESNFPNKKIMIVEFGYYHNYYKGNYDYTSTYPATNAGQKAITDDLITLLKKHSQVNGLFWWYPEENSALNNWLNYGLFDCYDGNKALPALFELKNFK